MDVLALLMFGDQLAVTQDRQLISFFEAIAVGLNESDFGAIDPLLLDAGEILVWSSLIFLNELVPGGDLFIEPFDVLEGIF